MEYNKQFYPISAINPIYYPNPYDEWNGEVKLGRISKNARQKARKRKRKK